MTQQQEIGQRLERDKSTGTLWLQKYRRGGLTELLQINKAPGNDRKIKGEVLEQAVETFKKTWVRH